MGFEPTRAEPNGLAVHRLNHSATSSTTLWNSLYLKIGRFCNIVGYVPSNEMTQWSLAIGDVFQFI